MVSVIIVNYNGEKFLDHCLQTLIEKTKNIEYEIILVDNASTDNGTNLVRQKYPQVHIIESTTNLGFSAGNNLGVKKCRGDKLLFLNNDTYLLEDSLAILSELMDQRKDIGAAGPRLIFPDGRHQLSCGALPNILVEATDKIRYGFDSGCKSFSSKIHDRILSSDREVGWVTGACLMVRRDIFERISGFDENMFMYFEDKDLCKRVHATGSKVLFSPRTSVVHLLGGSGMVIPKATLDSRYRKCQIYYYKKHLGRMQQFLLSVYLTLSGKS
jgi:GT2 family glycosyltransferase